MSKLILRTAVFGVLFVALVGLPMAAQTIIPPGKDLWVRIPSEGGHPFRGEGGHRSEAKAATDSETKAATDSDVKAATF